MLKFTRAGLIRIASAIAATGTLGTAHADFVTSWDYSITTQFNNANTFNGSATAGPMGFTGSRVENGRQVSWGYSGGNVFNTTGNVNTERSGITISDGIGAGPGGNDTTVNAQKGNVVTNDLTSTGIGTGAWITHHNNALSGSYSTLLTTKIDSTLSLWAYPPGDDGSPADTGPTTLTFSVFFAETPNTAGTCAAASPPGNPCNDIFALNAADVLNRSFFYDGTEYFVQIFPITGPGLGGFSLLSNAECAAAGAANGCIGFTTIEGQDTTIQFGFAVTGERISLVPEPGSLALAGLGLSLFGLLRRRKA